MVNANDYVKVGSDTEWSNFLSLYENRGTELSIEKKSITDIRDMNHDESGPSRRDVYYWTDGDFIHEARQVGNKAQITRQHRDPWDNMIFLPFVFAAAGAALVGSSVTSAVTTEAAVQTATTVASAETATTAIGMGLDGVAADSMATYAVGGAATPAAAVASNALSTLQTTGKIAATAKTVNDLFNPPARPTPVVNIFGKPNMETAKPTLISTNQPTSQMPNQDSQRKSLLPPTLFGMDSKKALVIAVVVVGLYVAYKYDFFGKAAEVVPTA